MSNQKEQSYNAHPALHGMGASLKNATLALVGVRQLLSEFSAAAAHYDGLIDAIERAGWDISKLEKVKHAFDSTAQSLLAELVANYPAMSATEQQIVLEPYQAALHRFSHMSAREKQALRSEYDRFVRLRARSQQILATEQVAS